VIDQLRWLHVSDFHIVASGDEFSQGVAMQSLLEDIATRVDERHPMSFVLVTGDIAFSGKEQEYERPRGFLLELVVRRSRHTLPARALLYLRTAAGMLMRPACKQS
jgi:3',5'-cyclic AMP phosphodiesterase CpdA